ncbi:MAG: hypothetical protein ACFFDW_07295 [Candidatus Thorarchaeota archaeon]
MLKNEKDQKQRQTKGSKEGKVFLVFMIVMIFLYFIPANLNIYIDYSSLPPSFIGTALLLFLISMILTFITILVNGTLFIVQKKKIHSLENENSEEFVTEQITPTLKMLKPWKIFFWVSSISAFSLLIVYIVYLWVVLIISL